MTNQTKRPKRKWALVINQSAGGSVSAGEALVDSLQRLFHEEGFSTQVKMVPGDEIERTIRSALRRGVDGIAVGGGDGTMSTAAGVLAHGSVPLGVLPLGTLNHFAKDLGIPLELPAAVRAIAEGRISRIDLGEVNGHCFINNSSIGGYPDVIRAREYQRHRLGRSKWPAHALAFFRFLKRFKVMKVLLHLDGTGVSRKTPFVFVGNNEYELEQTLTAERRSLTKGCLCVYTARCDHWFQFLHLFGLLLANRITNARRFDAHIVNEARVQTRRNHLYVSRDGEVFKMEAPLHYCIRPRSLSVIVSKTPPET